MTARSLRRSPTRSTCASIHGDALDACAALLGAGARLLFIDNCEHLLDGVRRVVQHLINECPQLTVLATSREPLGLPAEQRLRLAPLSVSEPTDLDSVERSPAVALFVDRATRLQPDFSLEPDQLAAVTEIVRRLDGLPLAIELAAARLSALGLVDLHARIDQALDLLGRPTAAAAPCDRRSDGPTPCSPRASRHCSATSASSPTGSTSPPQKRSRPNSTQGPCR